MSKLEGEALNTPSFIHFQNYNDPFFEPEDENTTQNNSPEEPLPWDAFNCIPIKKKSESMHTKKFLDNLIRIIKILIYGILFCTVLCSALIAKLIVLFAVSQLQEEKSTKFCDYYRRYEEDLLVQNSIRGRVIWTWHIIFMFLIPECFTMMYAIWYYLFKKKVKMPKKQSMALLFFLETIHSSGLAVLIFYCFPQINSIDAAAISNCIFFIPALLNLFSQSERYPITSKMFILVLACNILALLAQGCGLFLQSFLNYKSYDPLIWILPTALVLSSCRWWGNYISHYTCGFIAMLVTTKVDLKNNYHILQGYIAFWRSLIFILSAAVISAFKNIEIHEFFMWEREYGISLISTSNTFHINNNTEVAYLTAYTSAPLGAFLLQTFCVFLTYEAAKFAYKTQMHKFGFAFPISLVTPGTILLITVLCIVRERDTCVFHKFIPDYLFLKEPKYDNISEFLFNWRVWCWISWWLSQIWITIQLWLGENEKLAAADKIFYNRTYDSLMIDQFIGLNKRRHESYGIIKEKVLSNSNEEFEIGSSKDNTNNKQNACITQIYACATMWHEDKDEMNELIGSILRLDRDQCAMKVTQKYYKIAIRDYYELETHIFFDDAFCCMHGCSGSCDHNENETQINQYVATFVETIKENIKNLDMPSLPPIKCPTPYGGQLIWKLPGKTDLTVHLKDKNKIRHRKRWSQVMYMYYLLGYRLMGSSIDVDTKELIAENTYILTLDGDIDFHPKAVKSLLDLMNKNKDLGAVCGRIHPVGKGPVIWFQKFEYAIGHWLQKSTEHVTGSVLCSPGCFSLFRAKALMQNNVLAKYATKSTEPKHYIQYDQGEDRWLCTLLLQAGSKVEYCAAGEAYTHAPESFNEFYVQRRRWIPSTMANTFDLLNTSKETRKANDNISLLYIVYQWILTGSTIIGPSFIYLMISGAFVTSFQIDNWSSFWYNLIPIVVFLFVCFFFDVRIQLIVAEAITLIYGLVMIIVMVGIMIQIAADGYFAPNTVLFFVVISQFILAAFLHPKEISCLPNAIFYYITVPSMYMLLIIFAIFNLHNITWGTRESKVQQTQQQNMTNKSQSEQDNENTDNESKFSLSKLFKCNFSTYKSSEKEEKYLTAIYNSINEINIRLKQIESNYKLNNTTEEIVEEKKVEGNKPFDEQSAVTENSNASTDSESEVLKEIHFNQPHEYSNYLINPHWLQDERLKYGTVDFLPTLEEEFWTLLIQKYLHPIEKDPKKEKEIAKGLIRIRNHSLVKFFMINTLFVVAIFLLQLNKNTLYLQWPFAIEYNISYVENYEVHVNRNYMHLEPIGCLFIIAFVFILFVQFLAMLAHRFNTFSHILANMKLYLPCCNKEKHSSDDLIINQHANDIVEGLQSATENEIFFASRRNTFQGLIHNVQSPPSMSSNFEVLFRKKLQASETSSNITKRRKVSKKHNSEKLTDYSTKNSKRITPDTRNNTISNSEIGNENKKAKMHQYDNAAFLNDNDDK
ncbi:chitin synthase chs-2-like [Osmia bicornis bicornis]|uniref:chitin synthase chs-2-like n=1 Tax=Osmia bicornis bicornis TaxID=1437191 RepID=UPI001EAF5AF0|nr:chitin synthase chs-2-like [Osmia bicornis bicornis]